MQNNSYSSLFHEFITMHFPKSSGVSLHADFVHVPALYEDLHRKSLYVLHYIQIHVVHLGITPFSQLFRDIVIMIMKFLRKVSRCGVNAV